MNSSDPCIPWYFPKNSSSLARICDPWEAKTFKEHMSNISEAECSYCLPDCSYTLYSASVTAAPFRRCDYKNLGTSYLCDFNKFIKPPIWGQQVLDQYQKEVDQVPDKISQLVETNLRKFADPAASGTEVFTAYKNEPQTYNAYDKDIAMVTFFFETTTVFEFSRELRMTFIQYISQIGGLLGLCLGFSFISAVEILYFFTIRLARNM